MIGETWLVHGHGVRRDMIRLAFCKDWNHGNQSSAVSVQPPELISIHRQSSVKSQLDDAVIAPLLACLNSVRKHDHAQLDMKLDLLNNEATKCLRVPFNGTVFPSLLVLCPVPSMLTCIADLH